MNKLKGLCRIISHPRELRLALSGLAVRLGGDDALGGLVYHADRLPQSPGHRPGHYVPAEHIGRFAELERVVVEAV